MSIFRFIFYSAAINQLALKSRRRTVTSPPVWPDWAIYWTLAAINLPKSPTYLGNFCGGVKVYHFLVKSFLGNFYRHLPILFWSHCSPQTILPFLLVTTNVFFVYILSLQCDIFHCYFISMFVYLTASSERRIICHSSTEVAIQCFDDFCDNGDNGDNKCGSFHNVQWTQWTFTLNKITLFHQKYWNNKINKKKINDL